MALASIARVAKQQKVQTTPFAAAHLPAVKEEWIFSLTAVLFEVCPSGREKYMRHPLFKNDQKLC